MEKIEVGIEKSKSRCRRNVVEKSQSESKTLDANDDGHYHTFYYLVTYYYYYYYYYY